MSTTSSFLSSDQQPNGFLGKSDMAPVSRDSHMTQNDTGSSEQTGDFDQTTLLEDPFYNFSDMGQDSMAVQAILDPSNPNSISFFDDSFMDDVTTENDVGSDFNPELFNTILSTGDEILARLESSSSVTSGSAESYDNPLDGRRGVSVGGASSGEEDVVGEHERMGSWDEGVTDSVFPLSDDLGGGGESRCMHDACMWYKNYHRICAPDLVDHCYTHHTIFQTTSV